MDSVVDVRECRWCHKPYRLHDGRYKYCSDECAEAARLAQLERNVVELEETPQRSAWMRYREEYWRGWLNGSVSSDKNNTSRRNARQRRWKKNAKIRKQRARCR